MGMFHYWFSCIFQGFLGFHFIHFLDMDCVHSALVVRCGSKLLWKLPLGRCSCRRPEIPSTRSKYHYRRSLVDGCISNNYVPFLDKKGKNRFFEIQLQVTLSSVEVLRSMNENARWHLVSLSSFFLVNLHILVIVPILLEYFQSRRSLTPFDLWFGLMVSFIYVCFYLLVLDPKVLQWSSHRIIPACY